MVADSLSKAEIIYSQFEYVFTPHSDKKFFASCWVLNSLILKPLHISGNGVFTLLDRIDVTKSSGPDRLPGRLLQCLSLPKSVCSRGLVVRVVDLRPRGCEFEAR